MDRYPELGCRSSQIIFLLDWIMRLSNRIALGYFQTDDWQLRFGSDGSQDVV